MVTLYHGTVERIAKAAPATGIKPYTVPNRHPDDSIPSFSDEANGTITLTNVYAAYQAFMAAQPGKEERWAVVEILVDRIKEGSLQPSLDWLGGKLKGKNLTWKKSLDTVGLCLHEGSIPTSAIGKVWIYNPQSNWMLTRTVLHTEIGPEHYAADQKKLSVINRWLTGGFVTIDDWLAEQKESFTRDEKDAMGAIWNDRSGLDLFYHGS
jgi:hypothetical protein